jgi:hypothetical protein
MEKRNLRRSIREISKRVFKPHAQPLVGSVIQKMEIDWVPTQEAIARRAYETFHNRGGRDGFDQQDWFAAERDLAAFKN